MKKVEFWSKCTVLIFIITLFLVQNVSAASVITDYQSNKSFTINGNTITRTTSSANYALACHKYEHDIYTAIWGENFRSTYYNTNNILNGLSASEREVTVDHLKEYISKAELGSAIRISPTGTQYTDNNHMGHSMILVEKTETGFSTLESGLSANSSGERRALRTYTWENFVSNWRTYCYINYIIWPQGATSATTKANVIQYFSCNVKIACVNGQTVNLYNNAGDNSRVTYFSRGQITTSTYGAKLSDGSTWYRITANHNGVATTFWLKYENSKMTVTDTVSTYTVTFDANGGSVSETVRKITKSGFFSEKVYISGIRQYCLMFILCPNNHQYKSQQRQT